MITKDPQRIRCGSFAGGRSFAITAAAAHRWLALELLMTDEMALRDDVLQEHLILPQEKVEAKIRAAVA